MFNRKKKLLRDVMVWGRLITVNLSDGQPIAIMLNKDGSMQTTWSYHGPDLDSTVQEELAMITFRLQQDISSIKSRWSMYFEAQRNPSTAYPDENYFPDEVTKGINQERRTLFSSGFHFESKFFATIYWLPPKDSREKIKELVVEGREHKESNGEDTLENFKDQVVKIYHEFTELKIPVQILTADETLTYLHSTVSASSRPIAVPKHPMLVDKYLYDTPLYGGLEPRLNHKHVRVISPLKFTKTTDFGYFDVLNQLDFSYRWITRCYCMSKQDNLSALEEMRRKWYAKLQSVWSYIFHSQDRNIEMHNDEHVVNRVEEVKAAKLAVEEDTIGFVYYSTAVVVMDEDRDAVEEKAKIIKQAFMDRGFRANIEEVNAVDSWMGCVPGMVSHNIRRSLISTGNFVHLMPLSDIWAGPIWNKYLDAPPLLYTQTDGNTPFRLCLHVGQVGHTLLVGDTGKGKSVHLNCIEAAFRQYKNARVIIFDNGASSKVLTYGVGGAFYDLGSEHDTLSFQPLAQIDDVNERQWAQEWLCDFLREEGVELTPEKKGLIRDALGTLAGRKPKYRTISNFIDYLQDRKLKEAFYPLAASDDKGNVGEYGNIFDSDKDTLEISSWQTFEMGRIMKNKTIVGPTLMYIFHRIENKLKGGYKEKESNCRRPSLIVLDECWIFFQNPIFASKIEDWLRTLRKYDASVVFATQSLDDIVKSPLLDIVLGSCPSHIFLPDDKALNPDRKKIYQRFRLNQRQIEILDKAIPQKHYYYTSPEGSRRYDLALEYCPFTLAYVAVDKSGLHLCDQIIAEYGQEHFNEHWLKEHGLTIPQNEEKEELIL